MIWLINNLNEHYKRAVDIQIDNIEEIIDSNVFLLSQASRYSAEWFAFISDKSLKFDDELFLRVDEQFCLSLRAFLSRSLSKLNHCLSF